MLKGDLSSYFKEHIKDEKAFGEALTDLINITLGNGAPFPTIIFQLETVCFELRYKQTQASQMIAAQEVAQMMAARAGKASSIVSAKPGDIPKLKKG